MHRLNRLLLPLFIANTAMVSEFSFGKPDLLLNNNKSGLIMSASEKTSLNISGNKNIFQNALSIIRKPPIPGGDFSGVCTISPYSSDGRFRTTWNLRPFFIWKGNATTINVLDRNTGNVVWASSSDDEEWTTFNLTGQGQSSMSYVAYGARDNLELGGRYTLEIYHDQSSLPEEIHFETLPELEWQQLEAEIELEISRRLTETDIPNSLTEREWKQEQAVIRAEIFQENEVGLWMDVFREMLSLDMESESMLQLQSEIDRKMCK